MVETAVIILNWNGIELLRQFIPRVIANTPEEIARIIVADNGSTDDSVQWLQQNYPSVEIISFNENHGFAEGYNLAIEQLSNYKYIVLLNSDAAPAKGWMPPLLQVLSRPEVVAAQPKILSERNHDFFEYAGAAGGFLDCNGYPYCRGRIFETVEEDLGQHNTENTIFWDSGADLEVKRAAYIEAGGLDRLFFAHMEEIDLCWRLQLHGGRILYCPRSVVYHLGGASLDSSSPQKTYLNFRNNLLMLHKNLPVGKEKDSKLFRRRLLDTLAWGSFIVKGKFKHASAILKAHKDFKKMRGNYRSFPSQDLLKNSRPVNILSNYYLKGNRTFDKLSY